MKFFLDHDVPAAVEDALERHEHDVIRLTDLLPRTAPDEDVFAAEQKQSMRDDHLQSQRFSEARCERASSRADYFDSPRSPQAECTNLLRLVRKAGEEGLHGNINFA